MLHSLCFSSHPSSFHFPNLSSFYFPAWKKKKSRVWRNYAFGKNIQIWSPHRDEYHKYRIINTGIVSKSLAFALRQTNSGLFSHDIELGTVIERTASGIFRDLCYEGCR